MITITKEQSESIAFFRYNETDKTFWVESKEQVGEMLFTFDKRKLFNLFADYPWKLTEREKAIFASENSYWVEFFKDRLK